MGVSGDEERLSIPVSNKQSLDQLNSNDNDDICNRRKRQSFQNSVVVGKKFKMNGLESNKWKPRSFESIFRRMQNAQIKRKQSISRFQVQVRWKSSRSNFPGAEPDIPRSALQKFQKFLLSKKMTHPIFYPKLSEIQEDIDHPEKHSSDIVNERRLSGRYINLEKDINIDRVNERSEYSPKTFKAQNKVQPGKSSEDQSPSIRDLNGDDIIMTDCSEKNVENRNPSLPSELHGTVVSEQEMIYDGSKVGHKQPEGILCPICNNTFPPDRVENHARRCAARHFKD